MKSNLLEDIIKDKKTCYFISPHLDDAALSAGGLVSYLSKKTKVVVITIFTEAEKESSLSAKAFLKQCGYEDPIKLYSDRRAEDKLAFNKIGVESIHLGYVDALWRKKTGYMSCNNLLAKYFPEVNCLYPTYKFHISKGHISNNDKNTITDISNKLRGLIKRNNSNFVVFCPSGIGKHVDHLVTKKAVEKDFGPIYWIDQPYIFQSPKNNRVHFTSSFKYLKKNKKNLLASYKTQIYAMFENKTPDLEEIFCMSDPLCKQTFPANINDYFFVKEILKDKNPKPFEYGLYKNTEGDLGFAKQWSRNKNHRNYYLLRNEINTYKLISKITSSADIKRKFPNIRIPELITYTETENSLTLLVKYINGKHLKTISENQKIDIYDTLFKYLFYINKKLPEQKQKLIISRNNWYWILILPCVSLLAIIRHPETLTAILRGFLFFIIRIPILLKDKSLSFTHRDLGEWNVYVDGQEITLFDFQLSSMANPVLEYASTSLKLWNNKNFCINVFKKIIAPKLLDYDRFEIFRALSICLSIYDLSLSDGGPSKSTVNYLTYCLKLIKTSSNYNLSSSKDKFYRDLLLLIQSPKDYLYSFSYSPYKKISIGKYNPISNKIAEEIINEIRNQIPEVKIYFVGSSSLHIMGAKDIDIMIEATTASYGNYFKILSSYFGNPTKKRAQFSEWKIKRKGYIIEINLHNTKSPLLKRKIHTFMVLKQNKDLLTWYKCLKKNSINVSLREYDRRKMEFFNMISKVSIPSI